MAATDAKENSFKLPGSSLDEVFKALQGYASAGKPSSLSDISKNTGMHPTGISKNVGFLMCLGLIEGGKNKSVTQIGAKLGLALMHNVQEEIESILSDVVAENEFLKNILAAVRIRRGMDLSALRSHIAYSAGLSKTGSTITGTGAVVELLKRSAHLREEDGKLVVGAPIVRAPIELINDEKPAAQAPASNQIMENFRGYSTSFSIKIRINISCNADDLDSLGPKIRKVISDLKDEDVTFLIEE